MAGRRFSVIPRAALTLPIVLSACATTPSARTHSLDECDRNMVIRNEAGNIPAPAPGSGSRIEIGDEPHTYFPPYIRTRVAPRYPIEMSKMGRSGEVKLEVTIDELGTVISVKTLYATNECFEKSAVLAIQNSDFYPAMKDGVEQVGTIVLPLKYEFRD